MAKDQKPTPAKAPKGKPAAATKKGRPAKKPDRPIVISRRIPDAIGATFG